MTTQTRPQLEASSNLGVSIGLRDVDHYLSTFVQSQKFQTKNAQDTRRDRQFSIIRPGRYVGFSPEFGSSHVYDFACWRIRNDSVVDRPL